MSQARNAIARRRQSPNSDSSSSDSSGSSSPPSSNESSSRGASSSSDVSPASSSSSTPPSADSRAQSKVELAETSNSSVPGSSSSTKDQQKENPHSTRTHRTTSSTNSSDDSSSLPGPNRLPASRVDSGSSQRTVTPLYVSVQGTDVRDVAAIQAQVEAALTSRARDTRRTEKTMSAQHEGTLRSRLANSSTKDYYDTTTATSSDSEGTASEPDTTTASPSRSQSPTSASTTPAAFAGPSRAFLAEHASASAAKREAAEIDLIDQIIAQGRKEGPRSGESLIDAVIAHHASWSAGHHGHTHYGHQAPPSPAPTITDIAATSTPRAAPLKLAPHSTSTSTGVVRQHSHSIPIATKHAPYSTVAHLAERARKASGGGPGSSSLSSSGGGPINASSSSSSAAANAVTSLPPSNRRSR